MSSYDRPAVPEGYQELLEELSYEVLKQRPKDFIQFSIDFLKSRQGPNGTYNSAGGLQRRASDDPLGNDPALHFRSCPKENFMM